MYLLLFLIPILLLFLVVNHFRKKKNIQKVNCLSAEQKNDLLNEIIDPFGYSYLPSRDIFVTQINAPQRQFGYSALYDRAAVHLHLIFDSLPIYFYYRDRTWLLEFWKGQYGINTGAEIGLYYVDGQVEEAEIKNTFFQSAEDSDMLKMSLTLLREEIYMAEVSQRHWWLTAFRMGYFSQPGDLCLQATVTFPTCEMANAFVEGLRDAGYSATEICMRCNTVSFTFDRSPYVYGIFRRLRIRLAQWFNRLWCKVYLFVTRPFSLSGDRLLYLYFYLPFAFRRTLRIRKNKKRQWSKARRRDARYHSPKGYSFNDNRAD